MLTKAILVAVACAMASAALAEGTHDVLGTAANPPKGPGPGKVLFVDTAALTTRSAEFAKPGTPAGNSFYAGFDPATDTVFVPSPVGQVTMLNAKSGEIIGSFPTITGARVAYALARQKLVIVLSAKELAAYSMPTQAFAFTVPVGGNAIATNAAETQIYVGGNMTKTIGIVDIAAGKVTGTYPVARTGDLLMAGDKLFSADIKTGVMSVIDTRSGKITRLQTPEVDTAFQYSEIPKATAGFMQLAKSPDAKTVYAAGFSGNILMFSVDEPKYSGELAVMPNSAPNKLSGLTIVNNGKEALVTVENRHEAALVSLADGSVTHLFKGISSNRWVAIPQ